jgi:membrane protein DedA with SNARE-associated domain
MYNILVMSNQEVPPQEECKPADESPEPDAATKKKSTRRAYLLSITGVVLTVLMFVVIIYFDDQISQMAQWGYLGAFIISILGGSTIIVPVPGLAVMIALASAMKNPWNVALLGFSGVAGEMIGAVLIYMTGHGAGKAISNNKRGAVQKAYDRMLDIIRRRGGWALFAVAAIINPFYYPAAFACGALRMEIKKYLIISLLGKIIKCMSVVYIGYFGLKGILRAIGIEI